MTATITNQCPCDYCQGKIKPIAGFWLQPRVPACLVEADKLRQEFLRDYDAEYATRTGQSYNDETRARQAEQSVTRD